MGVLVDDNNRVHTGDVLVELDKEPWQDAGRSDEGGRRRREGGPSGVENRVAQPRARVAALDGSNAKLKLGRLDFARAEQLLPSSSTSREEYDGRQCAQAVEQAEVTACDKLMAGRSRAGLAAAMRFRGLPRGADPRKLDRFLPDAGRSGLCSMQQFARTQNLA